MTGMTPENLRLAADAADAPKPYSHSIEAASDRADIIRALARKCNAAASAWETDLTYIQQRLEAAERDRAGLV